jgi:hypothetical protein
MMLQRRAPLTEEQLLAWADAHHAHTGQWPNARSGSVLAVPGETWSGINAALRNGYRGLPGGSSLFWFLAQHGRER